MFSEREPHSTTLLPERYKKALAGKDQLPRSDFAFIDGLLHRYNAIGNKTTQPFGRDSFFGAVSEIKTYATALRSNDPVSPNPSMEPQNKDDKEADELARPSSERIENITYLFLHMPRVKNVYNNIHAEKMERAFPTFAEELANADFKETDTLSDYFTHVTDSMNTTMTDALDSFSPEEVENLGFIIGYNEYGYMRPDNVHKIDFGTIGIETFSTLLEEIVEDALKTGEDIDTSVDSAFSQRDGIAQRLMTISLRDLERLEEENDLFFDELEEIPYILDTNMFHTGACPALVKMDVSENDKTIKRPIAYEYAKMIVKKIPTHLLPKVE